MNLDSKVVSVFFGIVLALASVSYCVPVNVQGPLKRKVIQRLIDKCLDNRTNLEEEFCQSVFQEAEVLGRQAKFLGRQAEVLRRQVEVGFNREEALGEGYRHDLKQNMWKEMDRPYEHEAMPEVLGRQAKVLGRQAEVLGRQAEVGSSREEASGEGYRHDLKQNMWWKEMDRPYEHEAMPEVLGRQAKVLGRQAEVLGRQAEVGSNREEAPGEGYRHDLKQNMWKEMDRPYEHEAMPEGRNVLNTQSEQKIPNGIQTHIELEEKSKPKTDTLRYMKPATQKSVNLDKGIMLDKGFMLNGSMQEKLELKKNNVRLAADLLKQLTEKNKLLNEIVCDESKESLDKLFAKLDDQENLKEVKQRPDEIANDLHNIWYDFEMEKDAAEEKNKNDEDNLKALVNGTIFVLPEYRNISADIVRKVMENTCISVEKEHRLLLDYVARKLREREQKFQEDTQDFPEGNVFSYPESVQLEEEEEHNYKENGKDDMNSEEEEDEEDQKKLLIQWPLGDQETWEYDNYLGAISSIKTLEHPTMEKKTVGEIENLGNESEMKKENPGNRERMEYEMEEALTDDHNPIRNGNIKKEEREGREEEERERLDSKEERKTTETMSREVAENPEEIIVRKETPGIWYSVGYLLLSYLLMAISITIFIQVLRTWG